MGSLAVQEAMMSNNEEFMLFDQKDIDNAFDRVTQLRYSQHILLEKGITITAHRAGHSIGGTVWKITKDTDQIIYAVDYNHKKERYCYILLIPAI
jgi:cleavage and polyadenylation specificity factor subunit 2